MLIALIILVLAVFVGGRVLSDGVLRRKIQRNIALRRWKGRRDRS